MIAGTIGARAFGRESGASTDDAAARRYDRKRRFAATAVSAQSAALNCSFPRSIPTS